MNEYQESLNRVIVNFCVTCDEKIKKGLIKCDCPFQQDIDILQGLVDKEISCDTCNIIESFCDSFRSVLRKIENGEIDRAKKTIQDILSQFNSIIPF